jgi:hypothetical protein
MLIQLGGLTRGDSFHSFDSFDCGSREASEKSSGAPVECDCLELSISLWPSLWPTVVSCSQTALPSALRSALEAVEERKDKRCLDLEAD